MAGRRRGVPLIDFLDRMALRESPVDAHYISREFGVHERTSYRYLKEAAESGLVERVAAGWQLTTKGRTFLIRLVE